MSAAPATPANPKLKAAAPNNAKLRRGIFVSSMERVVQSDSKDMVCGPHMGGPSIRDRRRIGAGGDRAGQPVTKAAKIQIQVFSPQAPVGQESPLRSGADGPSGAGFRTRSSEDIVAQEKPIGAECDVGRGTDSGNGQAARCIQEQRWCRS